MRALPLMYQLQNDTSNKHRTEFRCRCRHLLKSPKSLNQRYCSTIVEEQRTFHDKVTGHLLSNAHELVLVCDSFVRPQYLLTEA